jgi:hypothetical protein
MSRSGCSLYATLTFKAGALSAGDPDGRADKPSRVPSSHAQWYSIVWLPHIWVNQPVDAITPPLLLGRFPRMNATQIVMLAPSFRNRMKNRDRDAKPLLRVSLEEKPQLIHWITNIPSTGLFCMRLRFSPDNYSTHSSHIHLLVGNRAPPPPHQSKTNQQTSSPGAQSTLAAP